MNANRFILVAGFVTLALLTMFERNVHADLLPPPPKFAVRHEHFPGETSAILAGIAVSLAVVTTGLLLARWMSFRSRVAPVVISGLALAAVVGVVFGVFWHIGLIREEKGKWDQEDQQIRAQWEIDRARRIRISEDIRSQYMGLEREKARKQERQSSAEAQDMK